nr:hypothetical protein [Tanacetum cinerariifolium]
MPMALDEADCYWVYTDPYVVWWRPTSPNRSYKRREQPSFSVISPENTTKNYHLHFKWGLQGEESGQI